MGNGTEGDGAHLLDPVGGLQDAVVYGDNNNDGIIGPTGSACSNPAPNPADDETLMRYPDGTDTDASGADFCDTSDNTPGSANAGCSS